MLLHSRNCYQSDTTIDTGTGMDKVELWVLQANTAAANRTRILARNPDAKILCYASLPDTDSTDAPGVIFACDYSTANANESWFIHQTGGARINKTGSATNWILNPANAALQAHALAHLEWQYSTYGPFDGWFFDNTWIGPQGHAADSTEYGARSLTAFENPYQLAILSWLDYICPALHSAYPGCILIGNIPYGSLHPVNSGTPEAAGSKDWNLYFGSADGIAAPTLDRLDGGMEESFMDGGLGAAQQASAFPNRIGEGRAAVAFDKYFMAHSYAKQTGSLTLAPEANRRYPLCAMLLFGEPVNDNLAMMSVFGTNGNNINVNWYPCDDDAYELGPAAGAAVQNGNGTWSRDFERGSVVVNPTGSVVDGIPAYDGVITLEPAAVRVLNPATSGGRGAYDASDLSANTSLHGVEADPDTGAEGIVAGDGGGAKSYLLTGTGLEYGNSGDPGVVVVRLSTK